MTPLYINYKMVKTLVTVFVVEKDLKKLKRARDMKAGIKVSVYREPHGESTGLDVPLSDTSIKRLENSKTGRISLKISKADVRQIVDNQIGGGPGIFDIFRDTMVGDPEALARDFGYKKEVYTPAPVQDLTKQRGGAIRLI